MDYLNIILNTELRKRDICCFAAVFSVIFAHTSLRMNDRDPYTGPEYDDTLGHVTTPEPDPETTPVQRLDKAPPQKLESNCCQAFVACLWSILAVIVSFLKTFATRIWSFSPKEIIAKVPALVRSMKNSFISGAYRLQRITYLIRCDLRNNPFLSNVLAPICLVLNIVLYWDFHLGFVSLGYLLPVCYFGVCYRNSNFNLYILKSNLCKEEIALKKQLTKDSTKAKEKLKTTISVMEKKVKDLTLATHSISGRIGNFFGFMSIEIPKIKGLTNIVRNVENQERDYWLKQLRSQICDFTIDHEKFGEDAKYQQFSKDVIDAACDYEFVVRKNRQKMKTFDAKRDAEIQKASEHVQSSLDDLLFVASLGLRER